MKNHIFHVWILWTVPPTLKYYHQLRRCKVHLGNCSSSTSSPHECITYKNELMYLKINIIHTINTGIIRYIGSSNKFYLSRKESDPSSVKERDWISLIWNLNSVCWMRSGQLSCCIPWRKVQLRVPTECSGVIINGLNLCLQTHTVVW